MFRFILFALLSPQLFAKSVSNPAHPSKHMEGTPPFSHLLTHWTCALFSSPSVMTTKRTVPFHPSSM